MQSITNFINQNGITLTAEPIDHNPNYPNWQGAHRKVTLTNGQEQIVLYLTSTKPEDGEPTADYVLYRMMQEVYPFDVAPDYKGWLEEVCEDDCPESRKDYEDDGKMSAQLHQFLGTLYQPLQELASKAEY